jgi:ribosomal protein S15P/S13E
MAKDNNRVMTLHPDEHVAIIIDRVGNTRQWLQAEYGDVTEFYELEDVVDELEALRSYLRAQRLGDYS